MSAALQGLLERVEGAGGPDRELDADLMIQFEAPGSVKVKQKTGGWTTAHPKYAKGAMNYMIVGKTKYPDQYTSSVDAALALVERVLPEWQVYMEVLRPANGGCRASVEPNLASGWRRGATLPLAILSALLRALIAKDPS